MQKKKTVFSPLPIEKILNIKQMNIEKILNRGKFILSQREKIIEKIKFDHK